MSHSTDQTDRAGIHAVGALFTKLNWAFREQPTSDYGIDAHAEKLNPKGMAGGKLIALQIKSGKSYFRKRGDGYVYYGEERHREYWTNHSLPVFLVLHNPDDGMTLWQRVDRHLIEDGENGRWAIQVPAEQTLDEKAQRYLEQGIASDLPSMRRTRLALDIPMIKEFAQHESAFLRINDWVNKSLNFRGVEIVFGNDPNGDADIALNYGMPAYTIEYVMALWLPWLDYELVEYIDESEGGGEVAVHVLYARLSEVGHAVLRLEAFYEQELPPFRPEPQADEEEDWETSYLD